jgi:intein/homing endonuclease
MEKTKLKIEELLKKVEESKKGKLDLSSDEDLSVAIMNLVSIEEHFFFSGSKTGNDKYFDLLNQTRQIRKELLAKLVKDVEPGSEVWCLPPNTYIFANPAPTLIKKIKEGENVLTGNGDFSKVGKVFVRNYQGEMILIKPYYCDELLITPEHPVLCATGVREKQKTIWRKEFKKPKIVWKMAKDLKDTDFLLFPRYRKLKNFEKIQWEYKWRNGSKEFSQKIEIKVDENLLRLIGLYLSEGSVSERTCYYKGGKKHNFTLYFSFGKDETQLTKECQELFKKVFGLKCKIQYTHTSIDLVCFKRVIVDFFAQFGRRSSEKQLPSWIINLPNEKLIHLVWGLIKGDGGEREFSIDYFTTSEKLAFQLRLILFKLGILHSLKKIKVKDSKIGNRIIKAKYPGFSFRISGDAARILREKLGFKYKAKRTSGNFGYVLEKYVMIPIKEIKKINYSGKVYNLEVPGKETYVTSAGIVHNCISKHLLAASMRLIEVGTKYYQEGKKEEAKDLFSKAYDLWSLFFGLNLKLIDIGEVKKIEENQLSVHDKEKSGFFGKLKEIVKKIIDCCIE